MKTIDYRIHAPTVLDFLKVYLVEVLGIQIQNRTVTKIKEEMSLEQASKGKIEAAAHTSPDELRFINDPFLS